MTHWAMQSVLNFEERTKNATLDFCLLSVCLFLLVSLSGKLVFFFFLVTPRSIVNVVIFEKGTCMNEAEKQVITVTAKDSMCCCRCLMLQSQAHEN